MRKLAVLNKSKGCLLGTAIDRADTSQSRRVGLLKRSGLQEGEGLWIVPCEAIHTFFMRFDIDVLFLDRNKRVVKAVPRLRPWRFSMSLRARTVLELPAGTIEETATQAGDILEMSEQDQQG